MDAEHRHGLEKNELAEALTKLRSFDDPKIWYAVAIVAVALLSYSGFKFWRHQTEQAIEARWARLSMVPMNDDKTVETAISDLRNLINESSEPGLKAIARSKLATALVERVQSGAGTDKDLDEAIESLKSVSEDATLPIVIQASALYKLASVHETRHDAAAAKAVYTRLSTDARYSSTPFKAFAEFMSKEIEKQIAPVSFTPGFAPIPPPASAPATQPTDSAPATGTASAPIETAAPTPEPAPAATPSSSPTTPPGATP